MIRICLAVLLCLVVFILQTSTSNAQGAVRSTHGSWQVRCEQIGTPPRENCAVVQSVVAPDHQNAGMTIIILRTIDKRAYLLRVVAPLGILADYGVGVVVDGKTLGKQRVVRCLQNGCVTEVRLTSAQLAPFRNASTITMVVRQTPSSAGIGFPFAGSGLAEALGQL